MTNPIAAHDLRILHNARSHYFKHPPATAVQYSTNCGETWHGSWLDEIIGGVTCFTASPSIATDWVVIAGTEHDGLLRSADGGRRWRLENFGLSGYTVLALATAPDWRSRENVFAATDEGIYRSSNGGRAWQRAQGCETGAQALAVSPQFAVDQTLYAGSEEQGLYRSTDAGRTWQPRSVEVAGINGLWIAPHDPLLLVAGTANGLLLRSADGGASWECGWSGADAVLALAGSGISLYAGLYQGGLLMSPDGGRTWQRDREIA